VVFFVLKAAGLQIQRSDSKTDHECIVEKCDIFDFMTHHVGLKVLHPGGLAATRRLAEVCQIDGKTKVLDVGCGKGTSAIYLAEHYGCSIVGVDISPDSIDEARRLAHRRGLEDKVRFEVGDALHLPFPNNQFDATISQALLVLVKDKLQAVRESLRVARPGARLGWLELSWWEKPSPEFMELVSKVVCAYCLRNVETFEDWKSLLEGSGVAGLDVESSSMRFQGLKGMFADEGFSNSMRIITRYLRNAKIRKRMDVLQRFFQDNQQYFGYGIYVGRKRHQADSPQLQPDAMASNSSASQWKYLN
jgi:ubiquinone/menaquinone biosynthesis C-methylase UbiE